MRLSSLDAARTRPLAAPRGLLRACLARDTDSGASEDRWSPTSLRSPGPCTGDFESHHPPRRHRLDPRSPAATVPPSSGNRHGRRNLRGAATSTARLVYRQTLGLSARLLVHHRVVRRFSAAAVFLLSRQLSLCPRLPPSPVQ